MGECCRDGSTGIAGSSLRCGEKYYQGQMFETQDLLLNQVARNYGISFMTVRNSEFANRV